MAERIGIINKGRIVLVEEKSRLMRQLGKKQLTLSLRQPMPRIPEALSGLPLELSDDGLTLVYTFDAQSDETGIASLLRRLGEQERHDRRLLRGLEDDGVPEGERRGRLPERDGQREVPRRDERHDAERLAKREL